MPATGPFAVFVTTVNRILAKGDATEHTYRSAIETLIEAIDSKVRATNEPKRSDCGAPDFNIAVATTGLTLGHIEAKDVGIDLQGIEKDSEKVNPKTKNGDQLKRYRDALPNLLMTDGVEWRWYVEGKRTGDVVQIGQVVKKGAKSSLVPDPDGIAKTTTMISDFLGVTPQPITSASDLAVRLALLTRLVRDVVVASLAKNPSDTLTDIRKSFQAALLADLDDAQFGDMIAQTISYGLFAARVHQYPTGDKLTRGSAAKQIPKVNPFLRSLFARLFGLDFDDEPFADLVDLLVVLLNNTDMDKVLTGFAAATGNENPVLHFYERFLAAYDPAERERRGVFYTPRPVVDYIVRSLDEVLGTCLGVGEGLASPARTPDGKHKVMILDPACGTGTFLDAVVTSIREQFVGNAGNWADYVWDDLLPRLFGFELLMAPYAVAHMRMGMVLSGDDLEGAQATDFHVDLDDPSKTAAKHSRLGIFLTNTLEEGIHRHETLGAAFIGDEADAAAEVKTDLPIMVVLGNPPYRARSTNPSVRERQVTTKGKNASRGTITRQESTWIGTQVEEYRKVAVVDADGIVVDQHSVPVTVPLNERNAQSLHDDYVKFIRFAEWRIERTGAGALGMVTNHGYLDNPTFRGMRQHLLRTFSELHILDLHGNQAKNAGQDDGDENVFDIHNAGVAIVVAVRKPGHTGLGAVFHSSLRGGRATKDTWLSSNSLATTDWSVLDPEDPGWLFIPRTKNPDYESYWSIADVFNTSGPGIKTGNDRLVIAPTRDDAWSTAKAFRDMPIDAARRKYPSSTATDMRKGWRVDRAHRDLEATTARYSTDKKAKADLVRPILYRPFDLRWVVWTGESTGWLGWCAPETMGQFIAAAEPDGSYANLGFVTARKNAGTVMDHFLVTRWPTEMKTGESTTSSLVYPLYTYPAGDAVGQTSDLFADTTPKGRSANINPKVIQAIQDATQLAWHPDGPGDLSDTFGPEDVFAWCYAIVYSPTYRDRYRDYLRLQHPRIPQPHDKEQFGEVVRLGRQLVALHTLEASTLDTPTVTFPVRGNAEVGAVPPPKRHLPPGSADPDSATGAPLQHGRVYLETPAQGGQYFGNISADAWAYTVGGHHVLAKWIDARRGSTLTLDDRRWFAQSATAVQLTIDLLPALDAAVQLVL